MRFINGLKSLSKKTLLLVILLLFITLWVLALLGRALIKDIVYINFIAILAGILSGFIFVVMIFSFFTPIDKMGTKLLSIAGLLTIPIIIIFFGIISLFYFFAFFANFFFIAFFAYKWCIDNSIRVDNYLYDKKKSRVFTRIIEFSVFLILSILIILRTIGIFRFIGINIAANMFLIIGIIDLILLLFSLLRLIFIQKLSAFISLFFLLSYFYILYVVLDLWAYFIFGAAGVSGYKLITFGIDLIMFIYIIGSIFDRVDYIKETIKIFRVDTIALFVILVKMIAQIVEIGQDLTATIEPRFEFFSAVIVLLLFGFFTLFLGIYSIISHKEGEKVK